jgi:hypothetical protein
MVMVVSATPPAPRLPHPALRLQQADDLGMRPRAAEQKALALVAAFGAQAAQFGFGLDAFGGDGDAETLAEADDRADDRLGVGVGAEIAHEGLVDLDLVEREAAQIAQARIAGAEIIHRDPHPERAQRMQRGLYLAALLQQQGFGDLELQPPRRQARLF